MSDTAAAGTSGSASPAPRASSTSPKPGSARRGPFARIALFVRQVVAELRKVVFPTRSELGRFTVVVLVFVAIIMAFVTVVDLGLGKLVFWAFGG